MSMSRSLFLLAAGAAIGGALLLAYRVSQETGKSVPEALADVPGEAQRLFADLRERADQAVKRGREAYQDKQAEMDQYQEGGAEPR